MLILVTSAPRCLVLPICWKFERSFLKALGSGTRAICKKVEKNKWILKKLKGTRILILVTLESKIDGFNENKEAPALKSSASKFGTCQRQHSLTSAYQTPFQNQGSQTCVASPTLPTLEEW